MESRPIDTYAVISPIDTTRLFVRMWTRDVRGKFPYGLKTSATSYSLSQQPSSWKVSYQGIVHKLLGWAGSNSWRDSKFRLFVNKVACMKYFGVAVTNGGVFDWKICWKRIRRWKEGKKRKKDVSIFMLCNMRKRGTRLVLLLLGGPGSVWIANIDPGPVKLDTRAGPHQIEDPPYATWLTASCK